MCKLIVSAAFVFFIIAGCSKNTDTNGVLLRMENLTNNKLDSIVVINPAGSQVYNSIAANSKSEYKEFAFIYNYAYIRVYFGNQTAILQPIDYVGETKIENGKYTYRLSIISNLTTNYITVVNQKD
jgi:hypothetical protein